MVLCAHVAGPLSVSRPSWCPVESTNSPKAQPLQILTLLINLAVVAYLIWTRRVLGARGGSRADRAETVGDIGWEPLYAPHPAQAIMGSPTPGFGPAEAARTLTVMATYSGETTAPDNYEDADSDDEDAVDTPPTDSGHSDAPSQTQRNAEDESPS